MCESEDEAAALVTEWEEVEGVECEVHDLSDPHPHEAPLDSEAAGSQWEGYPRLTDMLPERTYE